MKIVSHMGCMTTANICAHAREGMLKKVKVNRGRERGIGQDR